MIGFKLVEPPFRLIYNTAHSTSSKPTQHLPNHLRTSIPLHLPASTPLSPPTRILLSMQCASGSQLNTSVKSSDIWEEYLIGQFRKTDKQCMCASGEGEELGRVRKRGERRRCREGGREVRGERGRWRGKERLEQDGGLLQVQRILLFDFSLKPVHLVHVYTLMVACRVCEQEREREREIPVITRDTHKHM